MSQPAWMEFAWAEIGQREAAGSRDNPRITAMYREVGHDTVVDDEVAWCAAFVGAVLERGGHASTRSLRARSYLGWGTALDQGRLGAVAVFTRGSDAASGHVALYLDSDADRVFVLGGNQGDAVTVTAINRARLLGFRWPTEQVADAGHASGLRPHSPATTAIFEIALSHVLEMEGGWTDDPHDPGGPTNFGITLATLAAQRGVTVDATSFPVLRQALRKIARDEVRAIFATRYWRAGRADALPAGLAVMHFDASVNHGIGASSRMLQEAAGVDVDGEIGPATLAACRDQHTNHLLQRYAEIRRTRYRALPHFWRFGRGWLARVDATLAAAAILSDPQPPGDKSMTDIKDITPIATPNPTAATEPAPVKWWGRSLTVWGALITAASTVLPALGPLIGLDVTGDVVRELGSQTMQAVQALGGVIGTFMTLYGRIRATTRLERRVMKVHV